MYVVFYSGVSGLHTCPPLVGQQHEITVSQTIQMQYTQSDMCVLLYRKNTICWYDIQYTYTAGTQTHRYTAKRGVVGVLTYCLLLYYYSGLACQPVSVNVLLLESPKPTGRSHCLTVIQRQGANIFSWDRNCQNL